jgi:hypothetical protein
MSGMRRRDPLAPLLATFLVDDAEVARQDQERRRRLEAKYHKLRRAPYKLFRATNRTFVADLEALPEFWRLPAHELSGPLMGDAHPENFGAVGVSAASAQVDCTDFDVVATGPLARDLARAACGLALAEDPTLAAAEATPPALARARLLGTTWADRLLTGLGAAGDVTAFARHLAAAEPPGADVPLTESTHVVEPCRVEAPLAGAVAGYLAAISAAIPEAAAARLVRAWKLHGKGASSFCVERTILLLELPTGARHVVEWKPQADAPTVCQAFRERRHPATRDPFLGLAALGGVGHVAQAWLVEAQKVRSKDLTGAYADAVARLMGVRLAELHARFTPAVVERVRGQPLASIGEALADLVAAYLPVFAAEWRAFVAVAPADLVKRVGG